MMKLVGYRPYSFKDRDTGELKEGVTIHAIDFEETDDGLYGNSVFKGSVSCKVFDHLSDNCVNDLIGLCFEPVYDKKGRIKALVEQEGN